MKKAAILTDYEQNPLACAIREKLNGIVIADICNPIKFNPDDYNFIVDTTHNKKYPYNVITSHLSLLPSFDTDEPVKDAFLAGVKVTGITVLYTNPQKILAQYPVFIYNDAHFDDLENELACIEQYMFPVVVEKIIKNEPFEIQSLMNKGRCGGCKGCGK